VSHEGEASTVVGSAKGTPACGSGRAGLQVQSSARSGVSAEEFLESFLRSEEPSMNFHVQEGTWLHEGSY